MDESKHFKTKPGFMTANLSVYRKIRQLQIYQKSSPTKAERIIWHYLRNKNIGYRIRRQHIIDRFIVDFVCLSKKLVIEIDGKIHLKQKKYDALRTEILNYLGFQVIRFSNDEIYQDPEAVAIKIKTILDNIF